MTDKGWGSKYKSLSTASPYGPSTHSNSERVKYPSSLYSPTTYPKNLSFPSNSIPYQYHFVIGRKNLQITIGSLSFSALYSSGSFSARYFGIRFISLTPFPGFSLENIYSRKQPACYLYLKFFKRGEFCKG